MIEFAWPIVLFLLPLPIIFYFVPAKKEQSQVAALRLPITINAMEQPQMKQSGQLVSLALLTVIWILLILAAARPQWLGEPINIPTEGREMMIAVDLSGSMQVEDMELNGRTVNRLDMLKTLLGDFIQRRVGDRLGLILFGDDAYMQTPMTFDRKTVNQMLDETVLGLVGQKTAIGDAMALAVKRFEDKEESNRVLLLLTDGQNTAGKITPQQALELAVARKITIYTIGIGADVMLQQSLFGTRRVNPSSELDEKTLQDIADQTGGKYFRARDSKSMEEIYQILDALEPVEQEQEQMRPLNALFYWPLALALILAFIAALLKILRPALSSIKKDGPTVSPSIEKSTNTTGSAL